MRETALDLPLAAHLANAVDTVKNISAELPYAKSAADAAGIVLRDDRKLYVGVCLLLLVLLLLVLQD